MQQLALAALLVALGVRALIPVTSAAEEIAPGIRLIAGRTVSGSQPDGNAFVDGADHTCNNWTSSGTGTAQLGHSDRIGGGNASWNSSHPSRGCSQDNLISTGGAGLFYCFAIN